MRMNNLPISGTILKEKVISHAQKLQVEESHASSGRWLNDEWLFYVFQPILKSSDLANLCYIKQNFSVPL